MDHLSKNHEFTTDVKKKKNGLVQLPSTTPHLSSLEGGDKGPSSSKYLNTTAMSPKFLHSDEKLAECYNSTDDEDDNISESDNDHVGDNDDGILAVRSQPRRDLSRGEQRQQGFDESNCRKCSESPKPKRPVNKKKGAQLGCKQMGQPENALKRFRWAKRQLHRSVSVDDLMEYQREFNLTGTGRCSSSNALHILKQEVERNEQRKENENEKKRHQHRKQQQPPKLPKRVESSQSISSDQPKQPKRRLSSQLRDTLRDSLTQETQKKNSVSSSDRIRPKESEMAQQQTQSSLPLPNPNQPETTRVSRNSIANSDLAEFKRIFGQGLAGMVDDLGSDSSSDQSEEDSSFKDKRTPASSSLDSTVLSDKLRSLEETKEEYQWGTRSLRKAILGSDLTTYERSVRTALLESSRENSCESLEETDEDEFKTRKPAPQATSSTDASTKSGAGKIHSYEEEDWGTRSLRKSIQQLDISESSRHHQYHHRIATSQAQSGHTGSIDQSSLGEEVPLDAPLAPLMSPWKDDLLVHGKDSSGLKMPRRVLSDEHETGKYEGARRAQAASHDDSVRGEAVGDEAREEFEFQLQVTRSRFRRSISSSDIERVQRHVDALHHVDSLHQDLDGDSDDEAGENANKQKIPGCLKKTSRFSEPPSSVQHFPSMDEDMLSTLLEHQCAPASSHPLLRSEYSSTNRSNDAIPKKPKRGGRKPRHQRSNSDEPELHMDDISDIAPRKPTRTVSRPLSPPPQTTPTNAPSRPMVRFAEDRTTVVEIPKVSEEMKKHLFYTKRDVKRFRMNEHRRQEEQIRAYMEYLNQKENALE